MTAYDRGLLYAARVRQEDIMFAGPQTDGDADNRKTDHAVFWRCQAIGAWLLIGVLVAVRLGWWR
jgi:hypothetical protein